MGHRRKIALVSPGDRDARGESRLEDHRLKLVAEALKEIGLEPELALYDDAFADEVRLQILTADAVLVWVNPIEGGNNRSKLDALLAEVADEGVFVSAHPRTIQKMGTKKVLFATRDMSWGSDVQLYQSPEQLRQELPQGLANGRPRVLKQLRGHSGIGVWKVTPDLDHPNRVHVRHAARGSIEQTLSLEEFLTICDASLAEGGGMIDQAYQERLTDGMIRCYVVGDQVAGFGHQKVNALFPAPEGAPAEQAPQPGPRLYYPVTESEFQPIRQRMEREWLPELLNTLSMQVTDLPLLWDADFFFGPKSADGEDTFVLGEINVSSVYPFPETALLPLAKAVSERLDQG